MVQLLSRAFVKDDPPAVAAGLTTPDFEHFARLLSSRAVREGLTFIARCAETGEMAGALLAEDSASPPPEGIESLSPTFNPIFDILGQLEAFYRNGRFPNPGESLHLFLLGVSERFRGNGIAHELVAECMANGSRQGYRVAVTEATNKTSQHIFRKQGFAERVRGSYSDHRFEGKAWFTSIAEHGGPMLMDKLLA
jgi:ribosomal protein S18 acetylase RimI-like enzyme